MCVHHRGAGAGGGGASGQFPPPNFLSQCDGYACAPPKCWHINIFAPPPKKIVPASLVYMHVYYHNP